MKETERRVHAEWRSEAAWLFALALGIRLVVVAWAASRFPPADDGSFYHTVATRIAAGQGYTWAWPDGAVTFAAHYPVGYPAILGAAYAALGSAPAVAMCVNAVFGALLVLGAYWLARSYAPERARWVALALALHPTLVLYTAALMTEALAAALVVMLAAYAAWLSESAGGRWRLVPLGLAGGALVLVRPQLAPLLLVLGAVSVPSTARQLLLERLLRAALVLGLGLALCLPWTLRNCAKMDGCVFVSANGGWNLLIGTMPHGQGSFAPIDGATVPPECRDEFGEAGKDRCFGRAGLRRILSEPGAWLSLAPLKLGQLFNHGAVASAYLSTSNPRLVTDALRGRIATVETLATRAFLLAACWGLFRSLRGSTRRPLAASRTLAAVAGLLALSPWGYAAELCLLACLLLQLVVPGRRPLLVVAAALLGLCVVTHIAFFGAPRYALIWLPWLPLLWASAPVGSERGSHAGGRPSTEAARVF